MLHKLACVMLSAGGLVALGPVSAQYARVAEDASSKRAVAALEYATSDSTAAGQSFRLDTWLSADDAAFGLTDAERFELRQEIRDAARDIYSDIGGRASAPRTNGMRATQ